MDIILGGHAICRTDFAQHVQYDELGTNKKYVALYFTASWCPPCKQFTKVLKELYAKAHSLEVVMIGMDEDESEAENYFKDMPWLSTGYHPEYSNQMAGEYRIRGLPTLTVLRIEDKSVVEEKGREVCQQIYDDKSAASAVPEWLR